MKYVILQKSNKNPTSFDEPSKPGRRIQLGSQWEKAFVGWQLRGNGDRTDTKMTDTLQRMRKDWIRGKKQKRKESRGGTSFQHYEEIRSDT